MQFLQMWDQLWILWMLEEALMLPLQAQHSLVVFLEMVFGGVGWLLPTPQPAAATPL